MTVPFVDLKLQYQTISAEVNEAMQRVVANAEFILGDELECFEDEFAAYCGVPYAVGVDSGISTLELALRAYGIGAGDEVITVSHTFVATVSAIAVTGARPVLVDIDPATYNMDPAQLEAAITPRTKVILPVHLYGQPADMNAIMSIARYHRLVVIEDACQAHGAFYKDKRVGALGEAGCFSFYPAKNLGAYGDGGMFVTRDAEIAERVRMLRNYGQREKYEHVFLAYNRRLDNLQAAVLRVKLRHLDDWNAARQRAANQYGEWLNDVGDIALPHTAPDRTHVYHLYVIQHPQRDALMGHLRGCGIATGLHYPIPVHQQPCYEQLGARHSRLPATESVAPRLLSLPIYPEIEPEQIEHVCQSMCQFSA